MMPDESSQSIAEKKRPYPRRCGVCGELAVASMTASYDADVRHDGEIHPVHVDELTFDKCGHCGEEFFTTETEAQICTALRASLGLLQPDQIRRRLEQLALTEFAFAEHLGVAPETVSNWLDGMAIQPRAMDNWMRVYLGFPQVRLALDADASRRTLGLTDVELSPT